MRLGLTADGVVDGFLCLLYPQRKLMELWADSVAPVIEYQSILKVPHGVESFRLLIQPLQGSESSRAEGTVEPLITLYQSMMHMCVMSSHKPIRIYMGGLILGVNTLYRLFCSFKLFPMVGKGLTDTPHLRKLRSGYPFSCNVFVCECAVPYSAKFLRSSLSWF